MLLGVHVAFFLNCTVLIYSKYRQPVVLQAVGGVQVFSLRMQVYVSAAAGVVFIRNHALHQFKCRLPLRSTHSECKYFSRQLRNAVHHLPLHIKLNVPWATSCRELDI